MRGLTPGEVRVATTPWGDDIPEELRDSVESLVDFHRAQVVMGQDGAENVGLTPGGTEALRIHRLLSAESGVSI